MAGEIVEEFAGPGGWDEGLAELGMRVDVGIESDATACKTRVAAGHHALHDDVICHGPAMYPDLVGFIASPPCQGFSFAGKGAARDLIPEILEAIHARRWEARPDPDPKVWLIIDLGRWMQWATPEWFALEQVPSVLPIWRAYAELLRSRGYSTWTGILNAADFGVPQTRERAILMASRTRIVHPPEPTHAEDPQPGLFGTLKPWVSMADALGWHGDVGFPRLDDRGDSPDGYRERDWRSTEQPSFAVTEKARSWMVRGSGGANATERSVDEPAPTLAFGHDAAAWVFKRPATTVQGDPRIWPPGNKINQDDIDRLGAEAAAERYGDRAGSDAIRLTVRDALVLQSFRPDYPVQGNKTAQFRQVGDAIPPRLAAHIIRALVGR